MTTQPQPEPTSPEVLTVAEVAERLRCSVDTVRRWIASGKLAALRVGAEWRIRCQDLAAAAGARDFDMHDGFTMEDRSAQPYRPRRSR